MPQQDRDAAADTVSQALVIGAGPAGLATAAMLSRRRVSVRVLERGLSVGAAWQVRYDGLRLNTIRWLSSLPGLRLARRHGRWVERDDFVRYLEQYAEHHRIEVETGVTVERVDRDEGRGSWSLSTSRGPRRARSLVIASGLYNLPRTPVWEGLGDFEGRLLNAAELGSAAELAGEDVLVVGAGNTGTEIAQQLVAAGAARVRLSTRTPPNIVPRELLGVPTHPLALLGRWSPPALLDRSTRVVARLIYGDLAPLGLPPPPDGVHTTSLRQRPPVIDTGFVRLVKEGSIEVVAAIDSLSGSEVVLSDGRRVVPDTVIAAVGYGSGLKRLTGHLDVLDDSGKPLVGAPRSPQGASGLYFVGYAPRLGGLLFDLGWEARRTARAIARAQRRRG